jgi:hypothetical protein
VPEAFAPPGRFFQGVSLAAGAGRRLTSTPGQKSPAPSHSTPSGLVSVGVLAQGGSSAQELCPPTTGGTLAGRYSVLRAAKKHLLRMPESSSTISRPNMRTRPTRISTKNSNLHPFNLIIAGLPKPRPIYASCSKAWPKAGPIASTLSTFPWERSSHLTWRFADCTVPCPQRPAPFLPLPHLHHRL